MSHLVFDDSVVQKAEDRFAQTIMSQQPHLTRFYAKGIASQLTSLTINAEIFRLHGIEPASPEWMAQFPPATGQAPELIYVYAFLQGFYGLENLIDEAGADRNCGSNLATEAAKRIVTVVGQNVRPLAQVAPATPPRFLAPGVIIGAQFYQKPAEPRGEIEVTKP